MNITVDRPESYTAAWATPELVGRKSVKDCIRGILNARSARPRVIFLYGRGGYGKTRLLIDTLEGARANYGMLVSSNLIDLYHVQNHTAIELAKTIHIVLGEPVALEPFNKVYIEYNTKRLSGDLEGIAKLRENMLDTFDAGMQALGQQLCVLLAFDTVERLAYGTGSIPGQLEQTAESWQWLMGALPKWSNVVVLMAGRPEQTDPLRRQALVNFGAYYVEILVDAFDLADSLDYFDAVARMAEQEGINNIARSLAKLGEGTRQVAHLYANGQPVLLALLIDYLCVGGPEGLPIALRTPFAQAILKTKDEFAAIHDELEEALIAKLVEDKDIGLTILALGRAPKGVDVTLLAKLLQISDAEAEQKLQEVRRLSFVKTRVADQRTFLHDEMYAMLSRQAYSAVDAPKWKEAQDAIQQYYEDQDRLFAAHMNDLYAPIEQEGRPFNMGELNALTEAHTKRRSMLTEDVYYRLRKNAAFGYERYYRYNREAMMAGDIALHQQLQIEMITFLTERDPQGRDKIIDGLHRHLVMWTLAISPVVIAAIEQNYKKVIELAQQLRQKEFSIMTAGAPGSEAVLNAWEAYALINMGGEQNLRESRDKLDSTISVLEQYLGHEDTNDFSAIKWRTKAVLAFSYRERAFQQRMRGYMQGAVDDYSHAIKLLDGINLKVELATALNDKAFALAELGQWGLAHNMARRALDIRRELGHLLPIGLSTNTLGLIDTRQGKYHEAIVLSNRALAIFQAIQNQWGIGLAQVALAEAIRRQSSDALYAPHDAHIQQLQLAEEFAHKAFVVFQRINEPGRQVDALIEIGCACRDWASLLHNLRVTDKPELEVMIRRGEDALRQAAALAGPSILYRRIDALVNLAWLGYYQEREDIFDSAVQEVESAIPNEYRMKENDGGHPIISREDAQILLWPQLGKLHTLYGHRAFDQYLNSGRISSSSVLITATREYLLGLEYSRLYSENYQGIHRAEERVSEQVEKLVPDELRMMAVIIQQVEKDYCLHGSRLRKFLQGWDKWYGD